MYAEIFNGVYDSLHSFIMIILDVASDKFVSATELSHVAKLSGVFRRFLLLNN